MYFKLVQTHAISKEKRKAFFGKKNTWKVTTSLKTKGKKREEGKSFALLAKGENVGVKMIK